MSLQLVIPWRGALQQSPPPLHPTGGTLQQWRGALQLAIRCFLFTTLSRGLTLGAHPMIPITRMKPDVNENNLPFCAKHVKPVRAILYCFEAGLAITNGSTSISRR